MSVRGLGDRWLAGEPIDGVAFAHNQSVMIAEGTRGGQRGIVVLLMAVTPVPRYLVRLAAGGDEVRVLQSALEPDGQA